MTNDQLCHARRQGDELVCRACRLRWDVNDAERPECRKSPPKMIAADKYIHTQPLPYASGLPFP